MGDPTKHRTLYVENFAEPIHFGIQGGTRHFYKEKYGSEITGTEYLIANQSLTKTERSESLPYARS